MPLISVMRMQIVLTLMVATHASALQDTVEMALSAMVRHTTLSLITSHISALACRYQ